MSAYVQVTSGENDEPMEIPCEEDGTLLLSSLAALFPKACGLRFRNPDTGSMRGIRVSDGKLYPPPAGNDDSTWGTRVYLAVFPKETKRKSTDQGGSPPQKCKRLGDRGGSDLIVLGLPWKTAEDGMRQYFNQFGEVTFVQVKRDGRTGESKGYGFVRFKEYDAQEKCLRYDRHEIEGRWCNVRIPNQRDVY
ncbi:TAR DNA-binding protein 43-like [Liolophura sinensis]|uniref:TAR DNA-binding protein 43-like n=1 Tax=Liolophura sinensis TaxID=3198878 RepID=UPI0031591D2C